MGALQAIARAVSATVLAAATLAVPPAPVPSPGVHARPAMTATGILSGRGISSERGVAAPRVYQLAPPPAERLYTLVVHQPPAQPRPAAPRPPAGYVTPPNVGWTRVPILMYHYIRNNPDSRDRLGFDLSVTPAMFRIQLDYLAQNGFHVVSLHQAVEAIRLHQPLPSRPVVLTFDDGYADFYTAAVPELRRHGFTATDFVVSGFVGRSGYLSWAQVHEIDALGFTIGAHTVNHVALAAVAPARAAWEMRQSKLTLESALGHSVVDFAYPYGSFNGTVAAAARQLGFECAVSTLPGAGHTAGNLMALHRVRVAGGTSLTSFARLVAGP